uniref:Sarcospan n=1 Tax=Taeniopygia guttata TaxID=59729 RepID=A0A674H152_TAEGU
MGKEEKKARHGTSPNTQSQTGKAPGGEKSTGSTQESAMKKKQKKAKGDPKSGQEEESHTCCGCRFPLLFALLQLALGTSVTVLGFLMAGISSSLLVRDTPYWAGIIVCVVALVGFVMLCISYQPDEKTCAQFTVKTQKTREKYRRKQHKITVIINWKKAEGNKMQGAAFQTLASILP